MTVTRNHCQPLPFASWFMLASFVLWPSSNLSAWAASLEDGFLDPPKEYSMAPLWSWNGRLEPEELKRQIDQMVEKGVYGAFMHAREGLDQTETPYFSEGWWNAVQTCVHHGERTGFKTWIYDEDKWPSGSAGGRTIARDPEHNRAKVLRINETKIVGPQVVDLPGPGACYVVAGHMVGENELDPDSLADLTRESSQGEKWPCPGGGWIILAYTLESTEEVNYLNRETVRNFMDITHEEYAKRFGDHFGKTIPGIFFDEIMNSAGKVPGLVVWSEDFASRFFEIKGYHLPPLLPALTRDIGPMTPKVRCDYYDVYTAIYEEAWFEQIADWCEMRGLQLTGHTIEELNRYTTQGNYIRTIRHLQIPTTDNEDFRYRWPRVIDPWKPKQLAGISHLYGRERAAVEAMGGAGWSFTLDSARYGFNMLAAYGINFFIPHLFHYAQDRPANMDDWPNSWFFQNPYWKYFKGLSDHVRRISYMLTGGQPVVDVAILYPQANLWAGDGPGTTQETLASLVEAPIDVDLIDPDSLLRAEIQQQDLVVGQMRYRALVIPGVQCLRRSEMEKARRFVESGGLVLVHSRWPADSMEQGREDPLLGETVKGWIAGGGGIIDAEETAKKLAASIGPDIRVSQGPDGILRYRHIRRGSKEIYWLVNSATEEVNWRIEFRATGTPSLWQPEDGSIRAMENFVCRGGHTECAISLSGWQGCFVVFDAELARGASASQENATPKRLVKKTRSQVVIPIEGPWRFLAVGNQLDETWSGEVRSSTLSLPVMRTRWERGVEGRSEGWHLPTFPDKDWRQIKVFDTLHPDEGAERYRSCWESRFISYYDCLAFEAKIGGKRLRCWKDFALPSGFTHGWIAVVCENPCRVTLDGCALGTGSGGKDSEKFAFQLTNSGTNTLAIEAGEARALLAEGQFLDAEGRAVEIRTDASWNASVEGGKPRKAWEYVAPPELPFGEPRHPAGQAKPQTVWYRQGLPPGVNRIQRPKIEGKWEAWADGISLDFRNGSAPISPLARTLVLSVSIREGEHALLEPVIVQCGPIVQPLGDWSERNLDWYSGRAVYSATFTLQSGTEKDDRFILDLGEVCYCAEVWLNGKLIGERIWPPYRLDLTDNVRAGTNELSVVAANLIANRMHWDVFDDVKGLQVNRKWHDGNLLRDRWCFRSGLIGPVRLLGVE
jgi:hypothetical protein